MLIHLVGDDIGVIFLGQRGDGLQFLTGEHLAAGIGRIAEDQRLGVLPEGVLQHFRVKVEVRRHQRHIDGFRSGEDGIRPVVFIEG